MPSRTEAGQSNGAHRGVAELPCAWGGPSGGAALRARPEDFVVDERLPFEIEDAGEHHYLFIEKRDCNTEYLARAVARAAGVAPRDVSYAGLKDRNAVTRQWFSVRMPGKTDRTWSDSLNEEYRVLDHRLHRAKLRRGAVAENRFQIVLRELAVDEDTLTARLHQLRDAGVPNYFGEQRFGHDGNNIRMAEDYFAGKLKLSRFKRGMALSAARALIFNAVLAERVRQGNWNGALDGDVMFLQGSKRFFTTASRDQEIEQRVGDLDIHPSGPLWGRGELQTRHEAARLERAVAARCDGLCQGLERAGLEQDRRALRVLVSELRWEHQAPGTLKLEFSLGAGAYATSVLRELIRW